MKKTSILLGMAVPLALLLAPPAVAASRLARGQVTAVEQHARTANGGENVRLTIRTRQGERVLDLGAAGACEDCFRIGDRVRARLSTGPAGTPLVERLKVRRGDEMFALSRRGNALARERSAHGDGSAGIRQRDRDRDQDRRRPSAAGGNAGGRRGRGGA